MNLINKIIAPFGVRLARAGRASGSNSEIATIERNKKDTLNQLWGDIAFKDEYKKNHESLYEGLLQIAKSEGLVDQAESIIDVGCGPGYFLGLLDRIGFKGSLSGCDFAEAAILSASQQCARADLFVHDIYLPLKQSYDLLFCMETLEHLLYPERAFANLLNSSKIAVLTVPEGRKDSFMGHINFWSPESWEIFCRQNAKSKDVVTRVFNGSKNLVAVIR